MKKLLTVVCVAAFGIGAVAQAQVVKNESILQTEPKEVKADAADIIGMPAMLDNASMGQLKDATTPWRDTLRWHPEYSEPNCAEGIYSTYYSDAGMFGEEVVPGVFSPYLNGTGEVGATYQTKENLYMMYASIDVENSFVVGAIVIACRMGNTQGWDRIQDKLDRFPQDPEHMNEWRGVKVPDMPFRLMGYGEVTRQRVFESYSDMIFRNLDPVYINVEMPTTTEGRIATGTLYLRYEPRETDDGVRPSYYTLGGLFEGGEMLTASSEKNFGLSMCASLTGDKTYDSLWNYCIGAKSNSECKFVEDWSVWQRFDFTNHEEAWVGFWAADEQDIDVSLPWFAEEGEPTGFAPPTSIQERGTNSLFVYNHSLLRLSSGTHYKPTLYPIIQHSSASNEKNKDAYAQTISVYPLPATDNVTVVALDPIQKVEIYNMAGALVKVVNMNENVLDIDVTSFVPGTYIAKITTKNGVASKKLVVK